MTALSKEEPPLPPPLASAQEEEEAMEAVGAEPSQAPFLDSKPPAVDVPKGTVRFSQQSHPGVDLSVAGAARSRIALGWTGCCWSDEEVSASGPYSGVWFRCSLNYVMVGLKAGTCSKKDSYADLDYGLYSSPSGRVQVYERGLLMYTDTSKVDESSELQLVIVNNAVAYKIGGRVAYVSCVQPQQPLHVAISWHDHPAAVLGLEYIVNS